MGVRPNFTLLLVALTGASLAGASTDRASPLVPISSPAVLSGIHVSACEPMILHGNRTYTRLALRFVGANYASSETLYSDPKCEISVVQTNSQGTWRISRGTVLNLSLDRMQMRPLDPRLADRFAAKRTCGKKWENGVPNEILGTPCGRGRQAEYFVGASPSGKSLEVFECEGRRAVDPGCTHYAMSARSTPKSAKPLVSRKPLRK